MFLCQKICHADIKNVMRYVNSRVYNGEEYPLVMTMNLSIVARVLLGSRDIFVQVNRILS